jgi:hypothetical protein
MTLPIIVPPETEAQIHVIDTWWRANRKAAPDLFSQELAEAFAYIRVTREAGHRYAHRARKVFAGYSYARPVITCTTSLLTSG